MNHVIKIEEMAFHPDDMTIDPGDSITWMNGDGVAHQIAGEIPPALEYAESGSFQSPVIEPGGSATLSWDLATFLEYHCAIHPGMTGKITVRVL